MPIHLTCPNGHALRVKDKLAGKPGSCPTCGAGFFVPDPSSATPAAPVEVLEPGAPPPLPSAPATQQGAANDDATVEWRVTLADGAQFGPTVPIIFAQWITAGRVPPEALVWRTGWPDWRPAGEAEAKLPAPLPGGPDVPSAPPPPVVPRGATLPPAPPPATQAPAPVEKPSAPASGVAYTLRKKREARRRRRFATLLAVACLLLAVMLVGLMWMGPPPGAPVVPR